MSESKQKFRCSAPKRFRKRQKNKNRSCIFKAL
uniref:Ribosomal protein L32 n=1 Tax=Romanomermis culicivorax TaxID=13658 RepID=A0A915JDU6_ROMCU